MSRSVLIITWPEETKAYEALSNLKSLDDITINQAAVVQRSKNGSIELRDGGSNVEGLGAVAGSTLGALIGILGGPVGVLLGFSTGALFGSLDEVGSVAEDDSVLASMSRYIRPNATALVVDLEEINPDVVNSLVQQTGGKLVRRSYDDVLAEIMSAEAAAEAAVDAAAQKIRDEKRAERKAEREAKWEKTKEKFKSFFTKHSS